MICKMVRTYRRALGARNYRNYTPAKLEEAVNAVQSKQMSIRKASQEFKIPTGTLFNKVKNRHTNNPGHPDALEQEEEEAIINHLEKVSEWGFPFGIFDLRILVQTYLSKADKHIRQFKNNIPSNEWANNFLKRHNQRLTNRTSQNIKKSRAAVSSESVQEYFKNLKSSLTNDDGSEIPPENIFNYDETNLSDDPGRKKCIFKRGVKYPERIMDSSKSAVSIMFCGSASGSMMPCYVVYKSEHLWTSWTEGGPPNVRFNRSKSGWFDLYCFEDWFETVFCKFVRNIPGRKVIIGDNLSSHFSSKVLELADAYNISFLCLVPNSTHLLQPLDVAFYGPLKKYWRSILDDWKTNSSKNSCVLNKNYFPSLLKKLYQKLYASEEESSKNLVAGFEKCGICPLDPQRVLDRLPDYEKSNPNDSGHISSAVLDMLKSMRKDETVSRKKRSKINVIPGKSISIEELKDTQSEDKLEPRRKKQKTKRRRISESSESEEIINDTDDESDMSEEIMNPSEEDVDKEDPETDISLICGDIYIIEFCGKLSKKHYLGTLLSIDKPSDCCEVKFLRVNQPKENKFYWPNVEEIATITTDQIVSHLKNITIERRGGVIVPSEHLALYRNTIQ